MKILDIGCGGRPIGDVNCDLFIDETPHTADRIKRTEYFLRCDAHRLPFRDKTFPIVHASHLLEHLYHPLNAIWEMKRVASKVVYLRVPNTRYFHNQRSEHVYGWDSSTFENFLRLAFDDVTVVPRVHPKNLDFVHGRRLDKIYPLKQLLNAILRRLEMMELVAICRT